VRIINLIVDLIYSLFCVVDSFVLRIGNDDNSIGEYFYLSLGCVLIFAWSLIGMK